MKYAELLETLGFSKNEAKIYETLLEAGEADVGAVAAQSGVHRRNVYDTLTRLIEKGIVFEIVTAKERRYQAADPRKLEETIAQKQTTLALAMPDLVRLFSSTKKDDQVVVYRGIEGWRNYMRDVARIGEDVYAIGAKGAWMDPRLASTYEQVVQESQRKGITFHLLFDHDVMGVHEELAKLRTIEYKYLPKGFDTPVMLDMFGDHVVIMANVLPYKLDENASFTTIINMQIADAFRMWFKLLWDSIPAKEESRPTE